MASHHREKALTTIICYTPYKASGHPDHRRGDTHTYIFWQVYI